MKPKNLLLRKVPTNIIIRLTKLPIKNNSKMARESGCTYSCYFSTLKKFEEVGIVIIEKSGRNCLTRLTKRGEELANILILLNKQLEKF